MNNSRTRSMSSAFASIPRPHHVIRRSQSTVTSINPRSLRVVVLGVGGVGKTGENRCPKKKFCANVTETGEWGKT
ncbi:unnamed protein product [Clavelina lepadiformis]|uniref:Uncharacterized protein n=1 Tax=Clavelina lepadiformis TaxID=159417 RepID=A0ABP0FUL2_CLALP